MAQKTEILTPAGRLVEGSVWEAQTTDAEGRPLVIKNGPNAGQPRVDYYFGIAIPKGPEQHWAQTEWGAIIYAEAQTAFPSLFQNGQCIQPAFAFKVIDGDSQVPNKAGKKPCDKQGFAGNWVLGFSSGYAPSCYTAGGDAVLTDKESIKRGYYVRVYGSVAGNGAMQQPGVFLNHSMVEFVGYGEEIVTGPDGAAVFGGAKPAQLPAGASAAPIASATPMAQPSQMMAPPAAAPMTPSFPAQQQPQAQVRPAPDFLNAPAAPAPTMAPPPAAPAPVAPKTYTVNGQQYTAEQLEAGGWSPEQIAALG